MLIALGFYIVGCSNLTDQQYFARAEQAFQAGDVQTAEIEAKNALQKNPEYAQARLLLGKMYVLTGNALAAEKELSRAAAAGEAQARLPLVRALLLQRQFDRALAELAGASAATDIAPADLAALRAEILLQKGDLTGAKAALNGVAQPATAAVLVASALVAWAEDRAADARAKVDQALALDAHHNEALLLKGGLAYSQSAYTDAVAAYQAALDADVYKALTVSSSRARTGLAYALLAQGKATEAKEHIQVLYKANAKHPTPNFLLALAAYQAKDYKLAGEHLQQMGSVPPGSSAMLLQGAVNFALGNLEQADAFLSKYTAAVPGNAQAHKLLAAVQLRLNQPEKARQSLAEVAKEGNDAQLLVMVGAAAIMAGDYDEGRGYLRKAMDAGAEGNLLRTKVAETYIAEGAYDEAIRELEQTMAKGGDTLQAKGLMVLAELRRKDLDAALRKASDLAAEFPQAAHAWNILGGVHLAREERDKALQQFEKAVAIQADFLPALLNLARIQAQSGDLAAARSGYEKVIRNDKANVPARIALAQIEERAGHSEKMLAWLEEARKIDTASLPPRVLLGTYYYRRGDIAKAAELADEAAAIRAHDPAVAILLADTQIARRMFEPALKNLERLARAQPKSAEVQVRLGQVHMHMNAAEQARRAWRKALQLQPGNYPATVALAQLEAQTQNFSAAFDLVDELKRREPDSPAGHTLEGDVLMVQGKYPAAVLAYATAAKKRASGILAVKQFRAQRAAGKSLDGIATLERWLASHASDHEVRLLLADAYRDTGRPADAVAQYKTILKDQPRNPLALNNLAWVYIGTDIAKAREAAEAAYKVLPGHPSVIDTLGWVLYHQGEHARARELLEQARGKASGDPDIAYHLAAAVAKNGDRNRAAELLRIALAGGRNFSSRKEAEALRTTLQ